MPDPAALAGAVLACLGVNVNLTAPSVSITPPTAPQLALPNPSMPGLRSPGLPPIVIPALSIPFQWPSIAQPGMPAMVMGFAGSMLAGVTYALAFLPPKPDHLPDLPTIGLFVKGFTGAAPGLPKLPAGSLKVPGITVPFPGMPGTPIPPINMPAIPPLKAPNPNFAVPTITPPSLPGFDPGAILNMIGMFIAVPFLLFIKIIQSIINLSLKLPSLSTIYSLLIGIGLAMGFPPLVMAFFLPCVAKMGKAALALLG